MNDISLKITDIGTNGDGIARLENGETVFVPFAAMGDVLLAQVTKDHDGLNRGKISSILLKSPDRVTPPCRHFGICGGCALQHINETTYRAFKERGVTSALEKAGVAMPAMIDAVYIPPFTRRRANFAARITKGKAVIGFHERRSANIRDVPDCLLITEPLRDMMIRVREHLPKIVEEGAKIDVLIQHVEGDFEIGLTGKLGWAKQSSYELHEAIGDLVRDLDLARLSLRARDFDPYEPLLEARPLIKTFGALSMNVAAGGFLQPSEEGEQALVTCVTDAIEDETKIADLFCGNGTFTGPLMEGREIMAVDFAPDAIASLRKAGVNALVRNLFKAPMSAQELSGVEAVILDPPRAGAQAQVAILAHSDVAKVIYVSCNPSTFAKDARVLVEGGYTLLKLTLVDQFIWSAHTEVVGVFVRA